MSKRIQSGKVVRLGEDVIDKLEPQRQDKESWSKFLVRLLGKLEGKSHWLVPSVKKVFATKKEAAGFAVLNAVQKGEAKPEQVVKLREDG